jgi:hypothetical protein
VAIVALLNVLPVQAGHGRADRLLSDSKSAGQLALADMFAEVSLPDDWNVSRLQFGLVGSLTDRASPFAHHVGRVVSVAPQEKMSGIDAWRTIARMQDQPAFRNRAERYEPGQAVGQDIDASYGVPNSSVAVPVTIAQPQHAAGFCQRADTRLEPDFGR